MPAAVLGVGGKNLDRRRADDDRGSHRLLRRLHRAQTSGDVSFRRILGPDRRSLLFQLFHGGAALFEPATSVARHRCPVAHGRDLVRARLQRLPVGHSAQDSRRRCCNDFHVYSLASSGRRMGHRHASLVRCKRALGAVGLGRIQRLFRTQTRLALAKESRCRALFLRPVCEQQDGCRAEQGDEQGGRGGLANLLFAHQLEDLGRERVEVEGAE